MSMVVCADEIRSAFLPAARPGATEIASHQCDECEEIRQFFAGQPQYDIAPDRLELLTAALNLFTDLAFVYWLPAFMLAELNNEDGSSDDFADWMAWKFLPSRHGGERTHLLAQRQALVVADFLDECARRYPHDSDDFVAAAARVRERSGGSADTT